MEEQYKKLFKPIKTHHLEEMDLYQIYGFVITKMGQIEKLVDGIITKVIDPKKKEVFNDVILNSSIITWSGKITILKNILPDGKKDLIEKIRTLTEIRNSFAHHNVFNLAAPKTKEAETTMEIAERLLKGESSFKKLTRSGKITTISAWKQAKEFEELSQFVTPNLMVMFHHDINKSFVPNQKEREK